MRGPGHIDRHVLSSVDDQFAGRGSDVALNARELALLEVEGDLAPLRMSAAVLNQVEVIPTVSVKGIQNHGRTHNEDHFLLVHSQLELRDHFLGDDIPLLDINLVHEGQVAERWQIARFGKRVARAAIQQYPARKN